MVDNVAPKHTLGKRPSMEDVMTTYLGLLGAAVSIVATWARPHLLRSPPQGPSQCGNTDCAA